MIGSVYVVAHPDDDLIFQSPDLLHDIRGGACTTTVYLTSGDAGDDPLYPKSREAGIGAAYAQMAGVADAYTSTTGVFGGQPVHITTLVSQPSVQQVWFRLPDGNGGGTGYSRTGYQTLLKLYLGDISAIVNTQRTAAFSLDTLESALFEILSARRADAIRILDYMSSEGDHTDHLITARIVHSVVDSSALPGRLIGYLGNLARHLPSTLPTTDSEFVDKLSAFLTYAKFDKEVCQSEAQCSDPNDEKQYFYWEGLQRQYYI
ncbi:MAG: hypothetical protein M1813_001776 [Trichoglossum hirsutum]|nr:MAG: hypothetical protein M1813_001776 [Trichoglossum hirsutum]